MKNITILLLILFALNACTSSTQPQKAQTDTSKNNIVIDLDEEISILKSLGKLRNDGNVVLDNPIYIGDNDEVSFKGNILKENSPISIKIGDNQAITFKGYRYSIKTMELNNGEIIQMKNKGGNIFLEMEVIKD